jgi:protease-4
MKDFFKFVFATVVGIIVFTLIMGILAVMSIVGMVASTSATTTLEDNSVLVLNLNSALEERSSEDPTGMIFGQGSTTMGLEDVLNAIKKAKDNDKVKGIYIEAGSFAPDSPASMQAIRKALVDFKKSGKWIVAYGDQYSQGT